MSSLRSQPLDLQSLLILDAVDELSADEQSQLQLALAGEPDGGVQRRAQVEQDLVRLDEVFAAMDARAPLHTETAVADALAAVCQWQSKTVVHPAAAAPVQRRHFGGWVTKAAAAAVLLLVGGVAVNMALSERSRSHEHGRHGGRQTVAQTTESDVLALNAATSLMLGPDGVVDDEPQASLTTPLPATHEVLASLDQPFFDVPLVEDADIDP